VTFVLHHFASTEGSRDHLDQARQLMDLAFDDFSDDDWHHTLGGHHVVAIADRVVIGHAAVVSRVLDVRGQSWRTGYVEGVATHPGWQRQGIGSAVMTEAAQSIREHHHLGALSTGTPAFYAQIGWEAWRGPTHVRDGDEVRRTPEEDDAVMVLRFGPSADLDLTAPITCDTRPGDDW
jgi:aminoglycoside 2'-N-acetyltransferase I